MGIERFFGAINKNFNVVSEIYKQMKCDTLLLDFNSIIHNISSKVLKTEPNNTVLIIDEIIKYVNSLIDIVDCNLIYISIDGVPTFPKILEQKKRRFIGNFVDYIASNNNTNNNSFSKVSITPGTKFMRELTNRLREEPFTIKTIISDYEDNGEGEFKILDFISERNIKDFIIYSPDADLIILSMIILGQSKEDVKIKILRFDQHTEILNVIFINHLVDYFKFYFADKINNEIDTKRYILELSFIFTVFGNDFLPRIEDININMDLYLVLDGYIINYINNGYILNDNLDINPKVLFDYFSFLKKYEPFLLERNANLYKYQNFLYANTINLNIDIKNKQFNDSMIFYLDFGVDLDKNTKYGKLEYYFYDNNKLIKLLDSAQFKNNINLKYLEEKVTNKQKLIRFDYKANLRKHVIATKDMSNRDKELYLIDKKLGKYNLIFNPYNKFFDTLDKNDYYKNNVPKEMVKEYLKGLKWLVNYYFRRDNIDEYWYYKYHYSPLLSDFINYFDHNMVNYLFKNTFLNLKPIEQLIYTSPIRMSNLTNFVESIDTTEANKKKITKFIESNKNLFYNLDEVYSSGNFKFDCSNATFISKCHYYLLDDVMPINSFKIL
jgi:5'-3' exonuclease